MRHKPYKSPGKDLADLKMPDAENIHSAMNDANLLLKANNGECDDALSDLSTITCTNTPPTHSNTYQYEITGRPSWLGEIREVGEVVYYWVVVFEHLAIPNTGPPHTYVAFIKINAYKFTHEIR